MELYLKSQDNKNLFTARVWVQDDYQYEYSYVELATAINIKNYSNFLVDNIKKKTKIIDDFDNLNELRGWLWERVFLDDKVNDSTHKNRVVDKLKIILNKIANDYKLKLIIE